MVVILVTYTENAAFTPSLHTLLLKSVDQVDNADEI